tara:strand:- start:4 stop:630 length:627 start_codon:yes stop_codon:yes gene_type:complete
MIHILGQIPHKVAIAVSGGIDSMAALDFLNRSREVVALYYNHGTEHADDAEAVVRKYCKEHNVPLLVDRVSDDMPPGVSKEAWWREQRYAFFEEMTASRLRLFGNMPIITCHHLDDAVENWIFTCMHGNPMLIPYTRGNYIRPFLITRKSDFVDWCARKHVPFIQDPTNADIAFRRNYIRHRIVEHAMMINPGIHKTIKKKIIGENRE